MSMSSSEISSERALAIVDARAAVAPAARRRVLARGAAPAAAGVVEAGGDDGHADLVAHATRR